MKLHYQYGHGLTGIAENLAGIRSQTTSPSPDSDPAQIAIVDDGNGIITVGAYTFNASSYLAFPLGLVAGMQYNNNTLGNCFYATYVSVQFVDYFQNDLEMLVSSGDFFNLMVYDPVHLLSNIFAAYE